jgi:hypothetical protein
MAEPINLNKARKARERAAEKKQAVENRIRFGQPKAERTRSRLETERASRALDEKKRDS